MSDCCKTPLSQQPSNVCPRCGRAGEPVDIVTLKGLLTPDALTRLDRGAAYRFCRTATCPVVYFAGEHVFEKSDVMVRVFQKETSDPLPVCYCFAITRDIIADE